MTDVFELDKQQVKSSFSAASESYDGLAVLQRKVADRLINSYQSIEPTGHILDLGCGTGYLTSHLLNRPLVKSVTALDIAYSMLQVARCRLQSQRKLHYLCADAECLPVGSGTMDWVVSNVALQWCRNVDAVFRNINQCLKPNGQFLFATFGPKTLSELNHAWSSVDGYTHVNEFYGDYELIDALKLNGYSNIRSETQSYVSHYTNVLQLMRELKGIGAHNVTQGRNRAMTGKHKFYQMINAYRQICQSERIYATFEIIYISAVKN